jgi:hypothetical protein
VPRKKHISYSQLSTYAHCPWKWKLNYIDKVSVPDQSIHLVFGKAMHTVIQAYLETMYTVSIRVANELDLYNMLLSEMRKEYRVSLAINKGKQYTSQKQMEEFYWDGVAIIDWFKKRRADYFGKKGYELIGCEVGLNVPIMNNISMVGYLDVVLKNIKTDTYYIIDLKTSTWGWKGEVKKDPWKNNQLVLYKLFYAKQFNVPIENINVEFLILKRKLWEKSDFPQKRIQRHSPASGKVKQSQLTKHINAFISEAFTDDGQRDENGFYAKYPSKKNCRWCEYSNRPDLCDKNGEL